MDLMQRRRELMAQQHGLFNYLDPATWWIAISVTMRRKTSTIGSVERVGNAVVLSRTSESAGLVLLLGELAAGVQYTLSGVYDNTDGNAYIGLGANFSQSSYDSTRKFIIPIINGSFSFTPQESGIYDFLIWNFGKSPISATNVYMTKT